MLEIFKEEVKDSLIKEALLDSYGHILDCIEKHTSEDYCPVYSYDQEEEFAELASMKIHFEEVIEWFLGARWKEDYRHWEEPNV